MFGRYIRRVEDNGRSIEYAPRPLIQLPSWDGKIVLAGIFILGYLLLVLRLSDRSVPKENIELVKDALIVLGPPIGLIFHALFRSTGAEERREVLRSNELQTAITTPSGPSTTPEQLGDQVENGARQGTREGMEDALEQPHSTVAPKPAAADGRYREWLDGPMPAPAPKPPAAVTDPASVPEMEA